MKKILQVIKKLIIIWILETLIAAILYIPAIFFNNSGLNAIRYIIFLNMFRLIYSYWVLVILYFRFDLSQTKKMVIVNLSIFTFMSLIFSLAIRDAYNLFFQYSFFCNAIAIALAPIVLKKIIINLLGNKL